MFPMTITLTNQAQLSAVLSALGGPTEAPAPATTATPTPPDAAEQAIHLPSAEAAPAEEKTKPKAPAKKATAKAQAETAAPAAEQQPDPAPAAEAKAEPVAAKAEPAADAAPPSYQEAAGAVTTLAQAKGRDAAIAVLAEFGASRLPDVPPNQFAAVIHACEQALKQ